jgi:hypothetical protein
MIEQRLTRKLRQFERLAHMNEHKRSETVEHEWSRLRQEIAADLSKLDHLTPLARTSRPVVYGPGASATLIRLVETI